MNINRINLFSEDNCVKEGFKLEGQTLCPFNDNLRYSIFPGENLIVIQMNQIFALLEGRSQLDIPITAASWIVTSTRDGFQMKPSDGGFQKDQHAVEHAFSGDHLKIRRKMNANVEGEMGFTITNLSGNKSERIARPQYGIYTDKLLTDFILPFLELHYKS